MQNLRSVSSARPAATPVPHLPDGVGPDPPNHPVETEESFGSNLQFRSRSPIKRKKFFPFRFLALLGLSLPFLGFVPPEKQWEGGEGA